MNCSLGVGYRAVTDPKSFHGISARQKAGTLMSNQAVHAIAGRTLRHWTIDSRDFVGGSERPAPALPYLEQPDGDQVHLIASRLARLKSDLAHPVS